MRSIQIPCVAPIVVAAFLCATESSVFCGEKTKKEADKLSEKDEAALRAVVAKHLIATAQWAPGGGNPYEPGKSFRVLVLPQGVREIFKRKPVATLRALKRIIESGSSADAHAAIAYAHAAVGYANEDPVELICACHYAYYPTAKEFDDKNPVIPKTYRQFAVEEIDSLISDVEKQVTGKAKKQEKMCLSLTLEAGKETIQVGTKPVLRLTIENVGKADEKILKPRVDLQDTYYDLVVTKEGNPLSLPRAISDPGPISEEDYTTLKPGKKVTFEFSRYAVAAPPPGKYQIQIRFWQDPLKSHKTAVLSPAVAIAVEK